MDFEMAAERLMAATTLNYDGSLGVDWPEWKERYMGAPHLDKERHAIAEWLKWFAVEAVKAAEQSRAEAEVKKIMDDLDRMDKGR